MKAKAFFKKHNRLPADIVFYISLTISLYTLGFRDTFSFIIAFLIPFVLGFTTLLITSHVMYGKRPTFLPPLPVVKPSLNIYDEVYPSLKEERNKLLEELNLNPTAELEGRLSAVEEELKWCAIMKRVKE